MPQKDGFFQNVSKFFKRVQNQDLIQLSGDHITNYAAPASDEENRKRAEFSVFRQYLQAKNWSTKHIELFDEYRKMDATYPTISAALRLYSQEICLSGDCVITTPKGDFTIHELIKEGKGNDLFYTQSFSPKWNRNAWAIVRGIKSNGKQPVLRITVERKIDSETAKTDTKDVAFFKCTPNHKIMIDSNENFKEAQDLRIGDSIFSQYKFKDPSCGCKKDIFNSTKILRIESAGEEEVFDLINVEPSHHFAIKLTDTFSIEVHNCTKDANGNVLKIITGEKRVKQSLEELFFDNLKINSKSYLFVKEMIKFGNMFCYLNTRRGVGVTDLIHLPPEAIRIQLLQNAESLDAFKFQWMGAAGGMQFEPWEIVHWKNIEDIETQPYGQSILRPVVDTWRRIILMREALIIYRITRAPQRFVFNIDTTGMDPDAALRFANEMKKSLDKKSLINPQTGELDWKYNAMSIQENFYRPTFAGDEGGIELLQGASNLNDVEDYKIIKDDLFAGLLIPKSYLTFEEDLCLRESTQLLTNEGVKTIKELATDFNESKKTFALSCNKHGMITSGRILKCWATKEVSELYKIHISNGKYVECTENHPFLMENMSYINAENLVEGDRLKGMYEKDFTVSTIEIIKLEKQEWVYDLEVEEHHNFALEAGIFVHNSNKAALSQEDLRFSNAIKQYQSYFIEGLLHVALVHLHVNGMSKDELESFEIEMNTNSTLAEKTKNELLQQRLDLAAAALNNQYGIGIMSYTQVLKEILKFTDDEIARSFKDQMIENKMKWRLAQLQENGFYEEPDVEKKKALMMGMNTDEDVFSGLQFEGFQGERKEAVRAILTEKIDEEIKHLTRSTKLKPTKKMIENVIDMNKNNIGRNFMKTRNDMGFYD